MTGPITTISSTGAGVALKHKGTAKTWGLCRASANTGGDWATRHTALLLEHEQKTG